MNCYILYFYIYTVETISLLSISEKVVSDSIGVNPDTGEAIISVVAAYIVSIKTAKNALWSTRLKDRVHRIFNHIQNSVQINQVQFINPRMPSLD